MKDSFILYTIQYEAVKDLTLEQKGQLLDKLFQYASTGKMPEATDEAVRVALNFLRIQIDMDSEKYAATCKRRREAALVREAKKRKTNSTNVQKKHKCTETITKSTSDHYNDNENVNDNDNENVNDNDANIISSNNVDSNESNTKKEKKKNDALAGIKDNEDPKDPWQAADEETAFLLIIRYFNKCVKMYNSDIKPVRALTDERRSKLRVILKKYNSANFRAGISHAMQSAFLNGRTKQRKTAADFDWIMEESHFVRCIENSI